MQDTIWTGLLILGMFAFFGLYVWIDEEYQRQRSLKKARASKPVDYIMYDSKGLTKIRATRQELDELMKGRKKINESNRSYKAN